VTPLKSGENPENEVNRTVDMCILCITKVIHIALTQVIEFLIGTGIVNNTQEIYEGETHDL